MATLLPETKQEAAETLPDAWDYKGRAALRSTSGGWASAAMILGPFIYLFANCALFNYIYPFIIFIKIYFCLIDQGLRPVRG